jgi:hypothetical protein
MLYKILVLAEKICDRHSIEAINPNSSRIPKHSLVEGFICRIYITILSVNRIPSTEISHNCLKSNSELFIDFSIKP